MERQLILKFLTQGNIENQCADMNSIRKRTGKMAKIRTNLCSKWFKTKMKVLVKQSVSNYKKNRSKSNGSGAPLISPSEDQRKLIEIASEDFRENEIALDSQTVVGSI